MHVQASQYATAGHHLEIIKQLLVVRHARGLLMPPLRQRMSAGSHQAEAKLPGNASQCDACVA